ncbi:MAG TPA: hypothetical protein VHJ20_06890 [Polyangia bacterium]|nr:hypothetical protein [Polyangia bacterium]
MITVNGRVRATVRLKHDDLEGIDVPCVVESSWSSARAFPRTTGSGVPFEIETSDGDVYVVDPFEALLVLGVRWRDARDGARTEAAWISPGDSVEIEGDVQRGRTHPTLRARRISTGGAAQTHRVPPRSLARGLAEKVEENVEAGAIDEAPVATARPPRARRRGGP